MNQKTNERVLAFGVCDEITKAMDKGWKTPRPVMIKNPGLTGAAGWIGAALLASAFVVAAR